MGYRFKAKESVPEGVRRIVREEVESATSELLKGKGRKRDEAIHEARKSIKKLRGALRLLQPELGAIYRDQNTKLSETGRQLSEIRDAEAIIEVFNGVVEKYRAQLKPEAVRAVKSGLNKNKQDTLKRLNVDAVVRKAVSGLRSTAKGVDSWPLKKDGFEALVSGLRERYKRGRKAMTAAMRRPTPEHYHEWRKRVKDHWYHLRLLEDMWTDILKAREGALKDLETWLGDDHNLVVLREKLQADPDLYGGKENVDVFTGLMDEYSRELREKSLVLGSKVYEQKSKLLVGDLGKLWEAWQNESTVKKTVGKQSPAKTAAKTAAA